MNDPWQTAYTFYLERGYSPAQAAGIVGGLRGETENLNPRQVHDGGIGLGISGWNGPRLDALKQFAASRGVDVGDLPTQLAFVDHELRTSEATAGGRLRAAQTPEEAGQAMLAYFRPSNWNAPGAHPERARYAKQFADSGKFGAITPNGPFVGSFGTGYQPSGSDVATSFSSTPDIPPLTVIKKVPQMERVGPDGADSLLLDEAFAPRGAQRRRLT